MDDTNYTPLPAYAVLASMTDIVEANRFIDALGLNEEQTLFQRYPVKERNSQSFAQTKTGSINDCWKWVVESNVGQVSTVSIAINPTKGAKQADITHVQNVFADDDTPKDAPRTDWPIQPHVVNETSPGKYQYFWKIEPNCISAKESGRLQLRIAQQHCTDESLSDCAKKARLPGTVHLKRRPFKSRIVSISSHPSFNRQQLVEAFGDFTNTPVKLKQIENVISINAKGRNDTLMRRLSGARGKGASEGELLAIAEQINSEFDPPMDAGEVYTIFNSVNKYCPNPKHYPLSDVGNSERFAAQGAGEFGYNYKTNSWHCYREGIWIKDGGGAVDRLAVKVVRSILAEAALVEDEGVRNAMVNWSKRCESLKSRRAMIEGAKSLLELDNELFDADNWAINLTNSYLDLKSYEVLSPLPEHYCTLKAGTSYDKDAVSPAWNKFLSEFTSGDPEMEMYLRMLIGRCLTGDVSVHTFTLLLGGGRNGKTVFIKVILKLLGSYAVILQPDFFLASAKSNELETLELKGTRLAVCNELPENGKIAENRLKLLTGGDDQKGRGLYEKHQTFSPTAKFINLGNHAPYFSSGGVGIWSRIRLVSCKFRATPETIDIHLIDKLLKELPGILNWAISGLKLWQREGETLPKQMLAELEAYRDSEDSLGAFLNDACESYPCLTANKTKLYQAYKLWAISTGEFTLSHKALTKKLKERGITELRKSDERLYVGICLKFV